MAAPDSPMRWRSSPDVIGCPGGFGDHDVQQSAKVGGPHVMYDGENSADLFGFGRQYPQIGRDLLTRVRLGRPRSHQSP